jgi:hypothetical protein
VIAAGGWGLAVLCRARARVPLGVGLAALIPPVALALVGVDYLEPRGPMASFIPLLIALAAGLSVLPRAGLALTATLAALWLGVIVAFNVDGSLQREDYRAAARIVAAIPGRVALSLTPFGGDGALKHYLPSLRHYPSQGDKVSSVLLLDVNRPPSRRSPPIPPGFTIFSRKTAGSPPTHPRHLRFTGATCRDAPRPRVPGAPASARALSRSWASGAIPVTSENSIPGCRKATSFQAVLAPASARSRSAAAP